MTQINVNKIDQPEFNRIERLAMVLCAVHDGHSIVWRKIDGIFEYPYDDPNLSIDASKSYFCDEIINNDGKPVPQIFLWRTWCYKADQIVARSNQFYLKIASDSGTPVKPLESYQVEISTLQKGPEVVNKFSKEATDIEGI